MYMKACAYLFRRRLVNSVKIHFINYVRCFLRSYRRRHAITGAELLENNEASAKLTTANGGTFIELS